MAHKRMQKAEAWTRAHQPGAEQEDAAEAASEQRAQAGRPGCEAWACRAALQALPVAGPVLGCLQASNTQSSQLPGDHGHH